MSNVILPNFALVTVFTTAYRCQNLTPRTQFFGYFRPILVLSMLLMYLETSYVFTNSVSPVSLWTVPT